MNTIAVVSLVLLSITACSCRPGVDVSSSSDEELQLIQSTVDGIYSNESILELTARHRDGQTFLMWPETSPNARYNIYRHNRLITNENLVDASILTNRWGSLGPDTSVNKSAVAGLPTHFVVNDLSPPLSDDTGLFVFTVPEGDRSESYYAVTSIVNGEENTTLTVGRNSLSNPVLESSGSNRAVLTASINEGKGRIYTQYMDYSNWNPTLNGYAHSYAVTLPYNYDPAIAYPLQLYLHAYTGSYRFLEETEFQWEFIQITPMDPGEQQGSIHTWWYGYSADHNYETDGPNPTTGRIENFTEQRVLKAIQNTISDPTINVDNELIHIVGHSMGASGALSLGIRYPDIFSGIYASEPMTNYAVSPAFQNEFVQLWGDQSLNLLIKNNGFYSENISSYDADGNNPTGVWDWMNHLEQIERRSSDEFAYLMIDHGKADIVIDWDTQGKPLVGVLTRANVGFSANALEGIGHVWLAFKAVVKSLFGLGFGDEESWRYPNSLSFPSITNATGSSSIEPDEGGNSSYNTNIEWATRYTNFDRPIIETINQYHISLRSTDRNQTASITPRNTDVFRPSPGVSCIWSVSRNTDAQLLQSGDAIVDDRRLITIDNVMILADRGSRLSIEC